VEWSGLSKTIVQTKGAHESFFSCFFLCFH
jgi:hypothetical protein